MPTKITRRELYERVWSDPITKVAQELGISDVALHKICKKYEIPKPARGHWAKLAAGKATEKRSLTEDGESVEISISRSLARKLPAAVHEARRKAAALAKTSAAGCAADDSISTVHPIIERFRGRLEKAKPDKTGFIELRSKKHFSVRVSADAIPRVKGILAALVTQAEALGYQLVEGNSSLELEIDSERVSVAVVEQTSRVAHTPTKRELARRAKWEKERDRAVRAGRYVSFWDEPKIPEWDTVPNGKLVARLDEGLHRDGIRRGFSDGKRQRLENLIPAILASAAACAAAEKAGREQRAKWQREWEESERRRLEAERRQRLKEKRFEFLNSVREAWEDADRLERFVDGYVAAHPEASLPPNVLQLIEWARAQSSELRDSISPGTLETVLGHFSLMDEDIDIPSWTKVDRPAWKRLSPRRPSSYLLGDHSTEVQRMEDPPN